MVDFCKEVIGSIQWPPSFEDRMGDVENSIVDHRIVWCQPRNKILHRVSLMRYQNKLSSSYVNKGIPALPKITICYNPDCIAQLRLYVRWNGNHEPNDLLFD